MAQDSSPIVTALRETQLNLSIRIFLACYCVLAVLFLFAFVGSIIAIHNGEPVRAHIEDLLSFPVYLLIILGLKRRKKWAPPLICGVACFSMLNMLIATIAGSLHQAVASSVAVILVYLLNGAFILFFAYQLYFFARRDVREFFKINHPDGQR